MMGEKVLRESLLALAPEESKMGKKEGRGVGTDGTTGQGETEQKNRETGKRSEQRRRGGTARTGGS